MTVGFEASPSCNDLSKLEIGNPYPLGQVIQGEYRRELWMKTEELLVLLQGSVQSRLGYALCTTLVQIALRGPHSSYFGRRMLADAGVTVELTVAAASIMGLRARAQTRLRLK